MSADLRARFEAWAKSKSLSIDKDVGTWGEQVYVHSHIDAMWYAWQEAVQALHSTGDVWRCFHCDETFTDSASAQLHFGASERLYPLCQMSPETIRQNEQALARYREEDSDKDREMYAQDSRHRQELLREEEKGYARGVRDCSTGDDARDACTWSQEDEDSDSWNTSCGHMFRLDEGSPEDNGMKFCCYCGGNVNSERWVDEDAAITGAQGHE